MSAQPKYTAVNVLCSIKGLNKTHTYNTFLQITQCDGPSPNKLCLTVLGNTPQIPEKLGQPAHEFPVKVVIHRYGKPVQKDGESKLVHLQTLQSVYTNLNHIEVEEVNNINQNRIQ